MLMVPCHDSAQLTPTSLLLVAFSASSTNFTALAPSTGKVQTRFLPTPRPLAFSQTPEPQRKNEHVIPQAEAFPTHCATHRTDKEGGGRRGGEGAKAKD